MPIQLSTCAICGRGIRLVVPPANKPGRPFWYHVLRTGHYITDHHAKPVPASPHPAR